MKKSTDGLFQHLNRAILCAVILGLFLPAQASAKKEPFDHGFACLESLYSKHLKKGLVNYSSLALDKKELDACVKSFGRLKKKEYEGLPLDAKRAYWINAFNLFCLHVIVENYPIKARAQMYSRFPENSPMSIKGVWTDYRFKSPKGKVTLSRIENNILAELGQPLFIFAIANATKGGGGLSPRVYLEESLTRRLDEAAVRFIGDADNVSVAPSGKKILLSQYLRNRAPLLSSVFFKRGRFANRKRNEIAIMNLLLKYGGEDLGRVIRANAFEFQWNEVDWSLNDVL